MRKIFFFLTLILIGVGGLYYSYSKRSDCFSPTFALADPSFELADIPAPPEIEPILKQKFHFLGSGNQSYAFLSEDKTTVLKLFKFHCLLDEKKIARLKNALLILDEYNKAHSGVLYVHFPKTPLFNFKTEIHDKAHRRHFLSLESYVFVLQKKAVMLKQVLKNHLEKGDVQGALQKLIRLFALFKEDLTQSVYDHDHNVLSNTGFVQDEPMRIDFGKLAVIDGVDVKAELEKIATERIFPWVKRYYPQYFKEIEKNILLFYKDDTRI